MTAQKGRDLLLKIHNGTSFETVAGLRAQHRRLMVSGTASPLESAAAGAATVPHGGAGVTCVGRSDPVVQGS